MFVYAYFSQISFPARHSVIDCQVFSHSTNFQESIIHFLLNQIEAATKSYNQIEALQLPNTDVVLVSASSFGALKKAYPNYFSDISQFVIMMRELL